jgi:autotransporter-associated beta strand protein
MNKTIPAFLIIGTLILTSQVAHAGSATWNLDPANGQWNTAANWTPNTVPDGPNDIATFELSNRTAIAVTTFISEVNELIFSPGASAFTITMTKGFPFTVSGTGITNNSGIAQNFVATSDVSRLDMRNSATAGEMTFFTLTGGRGLDATGGAIFFEDESTAGSGNFVLLGSESSAASGGEVVFVDNSTAGFGTFTIKVSSNPNWDSGSLTFGGDSDAGNATFVIEGAAGFYSGTVDFESFSGGRTSAGNGLFIMNGGSANNAAGGKVNFFVGGSGGNATFIANPGTNGGFGGSINFLGGEADGGEARIELFGNGTLNANFPASEGFISMGSIEGDGLVFLESNKLIVGSNDLSTIFSGVIEDIGSFAKIGSGTLTLTGANTYRGGTTVMAGTLLVGNRSESGTGRGAVQVDVGILGGDGIIAGAVTIGTGSGPGAFLAPGKGANNPTTLTIQSALTFNTDATYIYKLNTKKAKADQVIANGVTISNGAQFSFKTVANKKLTNGKVFTVINNTAATPIAGTFSNLADGTTFTQGRNSFQVDYQGDNGNDLTLTVVP